MLLNASLTVYEHQTNSCVNWGWSRFTTAVLKAATQLAQPIVFMLWGANAQNLLKDLNSSPMVWDGPGVARENLIKKAYILSSPPSPFSVSKPCKGTPAFKGSKPFSTANNLLLSMGGEPIDWSL